MGHSLTCAHCGLASGSDRYCCLGCELAHRLAREGARDGSRTKSALTLSALLSMSVMMLSLFLYAEDVYEATDDATFVWLRGAYRVASAVLAAPVMAMLGLPLLARAAQKLRRGQTSMELLIASGALAAYGLSLAALVRGDHAIYFDSAVAALVLATLGRYLEARARQHAARMVAPLLEAGSEPVRAGRAGEPPRRLAPSEIEPGMVLWVEPEQVVPVDSEALGPAELDLSVLTGESLPVAVGAGELVPAGAVVSRRALGCRALRPAHASTLRRLEEQTRSLREARSSVRRVADRFARWLVPAVWLVALGALAYWTQAISPARGVEVALAVVLVACPCTYGVLLPLLEWLALRHALGRGVCVRGAPALERLARISHVAFDKTGTLTEPAGAITARVAGDDEGEVWSLVLALEDGQHHPLARALVREAERRGARPAVIAERDAVSGRGVAGRDARGRRIALGSSRWLEPDEEPSRETSGEPNTEDAAVLMRDGVVLARFEVGESLREGAPEALAELGALGVNAMVLSGDRKTRVERAARLLGIAGQGELSPSEKVEELRALGAAALVGDGVNDAPALASAPVGIAVGGASALARGVADVVLLAGDLRLIPWTIGLARRAVRRGWQSLALATLYNLGFVTLAALGLLRPVWAGVSMLVASLLVLASVVGIAPARASSDDEAMSALTEGEAAA